MHIAIIFATSVFHSVTIVDVPLDDNQRGKAACNISAPTCSYCGNTVGERECPEWTHDDVLSVIRTQLKQSATLAAIFLIYSMGALRFGFVLRKHIRMYQIDYV